jgi:hypothetical protein
MKAPVHREVLRARTHSEGVDQVLYAGVDAHRTAAHVTIIDGSGRILTRKRVASSSDDLRGYSLAMRNPSRLWWKQPTIGVPSTIGWTRSLMT